MTSQQIRITSAATWMAMAIALGWTADIRSSWGWVMLMVASMGPALTVRHFWRVPAQTMSESIRAAQR